ncbi:MAG: YbhB/YbcL family Raf kinase inhibitor-like protein, partial [Gammaproteobacteria bacterium]
MAGGGLAAAALATAALLAAHSSAAQTPPVSAAGKFTLSSTDISAGGQIAEQQVFNGFGCKGGNVSPALSWSSPPAGAKSFALLMHDPDAPTGSGWWHWVLYDIPASVSSLPAGAGDP